MMENNEQSEQSEQSEQKQEHVSNKPKSGFWSSMFDNFKASSNDALKVVENTREVKGRSLQVLSGSTLAVSISFLIALLGIQHLDTSLTIAEIAVAVSIPCLIAAYYMATTDFSPSVPVFLVNIMNITTFFVYQIIGTICIFVAFVELLWHIFPASVIAVFISSVFVVLAPTFVTVIIIIWLTILVRKAKIPDKEIDIEEFVRNSKLSFLLESDKPETPEPPEQHTDKPGDSKE